MKDFRKLRRTRRRLARALAGPALTALLILSALPARPAAQEAAAGGAPLPAVPVIPPGSAYRQTNLVSDIPGLAPILDPLLVNPWGISKTSSSPFWVANNATSTSTLYRGDVGSNPLVKNPGLAGISVFGGLPTGTVANPSNTDFVVSDGSASGAARFIFASLTGHITGWNPNVPAAGSTTSVDAVDNPGHAYTGLAVTNFASNNRLYAADFENGTIDVFDSGFNQITVPGGFLDPSVPADYHPFNIERINSRLYVAYAKFDPGTHRDVEGVGNGYVRRFTFDGVVEPFFAINGHPVNAPLNSPWGLALAPVSFGVFGDRLLVGNFGEGGASIHAFNATTGAFLGALQDESGEGIEIDELWALTFGNGGNGGNPNTLYFTAGLAEEEHGLFGSLKPTTSTATSLIRFATDEFVISEAGGHVDVTVIREGDVSTPATVQFNTFDESQPGHASQKSDYEIALGKLTFAAGETSKTFRILLVNDLFVEGAEEINLALSNPTGAGVGLGSPNFATITINDNDVAPTTSNPIDGTSFFVRQHYRDFLNREPDDAGLAFWANQIDSCGANAACRQARRINVSAAFFLSPEFQNTGYLVFLTHKAAFGPTAGSVPHPVLYGNFWRDTQALQRGYVFGTLGAEDVLEANKQQMFADFVRRPDFVARYATTLTPEDFVDALYANAGVTPTDEEKQPAIDEFGGAANTADLNARARALRRVAEQLVAARIDFNRAFVALEYFGYLRRDADAAGFAFWLGKLDAAGGNFVTAEMVKAFLNSSEYRQRFGAS